MSDTHNIYTFPRRLRLRGNTDFHCGNQDFYPAVPNLVCDGRMETSGAAERSPNIPPDNDPCPTKIAHQTWKWKGRVGGHKQFSSPEELLGQLVPSWPSSTRPHPLLSSPSFPPRKSYYFLWNYISEKVIYGIIYGIIWENYLWNHQGNYLKKN